ncbi:MAG: hypothetical protein RL732_997 [Bacteroidota bacterium]
MRMLLFFYFILSLSFVHSAQAQSKAVMAKGKLVYESLCIACHQPDGGGVPRMNPPLTGTSYVLGDKKVLIRIVLKGLKGGEVEIDGDRYENPMPPQQDALTDQQIADVLTYVRNSFGNKGSAVTVAEVAVERKKIKK